MPEVSEIKNRLSKIEDRNRRVELDKKWETSFTRRFLIVVFTYCLIGIYLNFIHVDRPWLNAVIPSLGFFLSTLTLNLVKNIWINHQK